MWLLYSSISYLSPALPRHLLLLLQSPLHQACTKPPSASTSYFLLYICLISYYILIKDHGALQPVHLDVAEQHLLAGVVLLRPLPTGGLAGEPSLVSRPPPPHHLRHALHLHLDVVWGSISRHHLHHHLHQRGVLAAGAPRSRLAGPRCFYHSIHCLPLPGMRIKENTKLG